MSEANAGNKVGQGIGDAVKGVFNTGHGIGEVIRGNINQGVDNAGEGLRQGTSNTNETGTGTGTGTGTATAGGAAGTHPDVAAKSRQHEDVANKGLEEIEEGVGPDRPARATA
ncbi:uncharacterized protein PFL1_06659 [Pseudozyma flocculosa PF-1]|uniref:Uncharacterized protein n=1 Tax=Pseudozyma flocculosa PF-1 TaxID=1277687 RepID=A0A061H0K3_9BASI|nr:uncharacterized protein PFL1_06659 [Pseudozyma flocculosa PF-1]EPQ25792.1 hypothetical protein PFL1_06659 [Pseudozyma flocculosa PF-1]